MKVRYPQAGLLLAAVVLLAAGPALRAYAVSDDSLSESAAVSVVDAAETTADSSTLWKAEISDYDSSLSLVQYEEVTPSEEEIAAIEQATTK